jgi:hypothetical protein
MVTIGADAHKRTHTFVAVDEVGRKLDEKTVTATSDGHLQAVATEGSGRHGPGPRGLPPSHSPPTGRSACRRRGRAAGAGTTHGGSA